MDKQKRVCFNKIKNQYLENVKQSLKKRCSVFPNGEIVSFPIALSLFAK